MLLKNVGLGDFISISLGRGFPTHTFAVSMVRNVNSTDDKQLAVTTSKHYSVKSIGEMRKAKKPTLEA
jgi:hypothetical protein